MKECGKVVGGKEESEMNTVSSLIPKVFGQVKGYKREHMMKYLSLLIGAITNPKVYNIASKITKFSQK